MPTIQKNASENWIHFCLFVFLGISRFMYAFCEVHRRYLHRFSFLKFKPLRIKIRNEVNEKFFLISIQQKKNILMFSQKKRCPKG